MKSYSKEAPKQVEQISPETYRVRWDIEKVKEEIEGKEIEQYTYLECTVYAPLTQNSILQAAIREIISQSAELKLINDYNATQLEITTDQEAVEKYKSFIRWRNELKKKIGEICLYNNIQ